MSIDLEPFRTAETLVWVRHTVFAPHRGDDGNLISGEHSIPLDTWLPEGRHTEHTISPEGVGVVVVDPADVDEMQDAIRAWCRQFLGRDDVEFPA